MQRLSISTAMPWVHIGLGAILLLALVLRLHSVNWDDGYGFHPDERDFYMRAGCMYEALADRPGYQDCGYLIDYPDTIAGIPNIRGFLDAERSPLNPHWFPLGSLLLYLLLPLRAIVELFTDVSALDMRYVGRPLSALADVGSVFLVFVLGRRMYGVGVGLLAALFTSLAVINVQNSHFYRPETFSVLFILASFWAMLQVMERRRLRDSALLGILVGLAMAPKVSVLPLLAPLALVYGSRLWDVKDGGLSSVTVRTAGTTVGHAALAGVLALATYLLTSPYSLLDFRAFAEGVGSQVAMASTAGSLPFTIQYIGTPPFLYQLQQTSVWGFGLPLGILVWLAVPFTIVVAVVSGRQRRADLLVLAWVIPSLLLLESFEVRFLRYMAPLVPFLILMGSRMALWSVSAGVVLGESLKTLPTGPRLVIPTKAGIHLALAWLSVALIFLVVAATTFYSFAFQRVYADEHPAVVASRWFHENVPAGTPIISDNHWDEHIPDMYRYRMWQFPVYEHDNPDKMRRLAAHLAESDYLVFYSNRPYSSVARDPDRFPYSQTYYQQLFNGELGYRLHQRFTSYPRLWGVTFQHNPLPQAGLPPAVGQPEEESGWLTVDLGYADDNVAGYDHPQVLIFKNEGRLSQRILAAKLTVQPNREVGLLMSPEEKARQRAGGTWSEIIDRGGWPNRVPILAWLSLVEFVYLLSLPLAMFLFRPLPDRGIVLARIIGLLLVSYFAWLIVSLGWVEFSQTAFYLGLLTLAILSGAVLTFRAREIWVWVRQRWQSLLFAEVLFLVAFLAFVAVRAANPDLWHPWRGGEKPMEFAYLNAVIRSTSLPPYDPWYSGGYLNYYYWGYFILAGLVRVTGILPAVAFNLAVPLFFALTFTGAYSVVYNLTEGLRRSQSPAGGSIPEDAGASPLAASWLSRKLPVLAGLTAGLFASVIGNLDGIVQVAQGSWRTLAEGTAFPPFDFWRSSRMIPPLEDLEPHPLAFWLPDRIPGHADVSWHITEFPFFTFLFADLHPHMMAIPFTLLLIGLGLSLAVGLRAGGIAWVAASIFALGVTLGSLWTINSWDYPSYLLLVVVLVGMAVYRLPRTAKRKWAVGGALTGAGLAISVLAFLPFHQSYETFQTGLEPSKWRTPIHSFIGVYGLFLFISGTFLLAQTRRTLVQIGLWALWRREPSENAGVCNVRIGIPAAAVLLGTVLAVFFAVAGYWTIALLAALASLTVLAIIGRLKCGGDGRPWVISPLVLLAMALAIGAGVDIVRIEGDIGRMNTQFKYYLEMWILLSLASAFLLWQLVERYRVDLGWAKAIWAAVLLLLVGSSLIYTVMGASSRIADRFSDGPITLNGADYMTRAVHREKDRPLILKKDLEAIRWLQDNVQGSPVVLEAHGGQYHWNGRISKYTGLPTVLGWPWHQIQQRTAYDFSVRERASVVAELYETWDVTRAQDLLNEYEIRYIVVGELERAYYSPAGLQKFQIMARSGILQPVFQNEGEMIYEKVN